MDGDRQMDGPWGSLEVSPITIQAPAELLRLKFDFSRPMFTEIVWNLSVSNRIELKVVLEEAGFSKVQVEELLMRASWNSETLQWVIKPTDGFVFGMDNRIRGKFYSRLVEFANNDGIKYPIRFFYRSMDEWNDDSNLKLQTIALITKLVLPIAGGFVLYDQDLLLNQVTDRVEYGKLRIALSGTRGLALSVKVEHRKDIEAVANYWGIGDHRVLVEPELRAMSLKSAGGKIDVIRLLPRFARVRLNTFVYRSEFSPRKGVEYDCVWTAMNFFNEVPDDRFSTDDREKLVEALTTAIPAPNQFGDLVFLLNKDSELVHACNYIGANIVFTKNGATQFAPFVFAFMQDVMASYGITNSADIVYRRLSYAGPTQEVGKTGEGGKEQFSSLGQIE